MSPGAPNRPPELEEGPAPSTVVASGPRESALRRLAPSRIALLLDLWKGSPPPDLIVPFERAETAFASGNFDASLSALDVLSVRFAEPRWPTLPDPFRRLRVPIPAPMPPSWDPEHELAPEEREARRARRVADDQVALAEASVAWAGAHGVDVADLTSSLEEARRSLTETGLSATFYERIDGIWSAVRERAPAPKGAAIGRPPAPAAPSPVTESSEGS